MTRRTLLGLLAALLAPRPRGHPAPPAKCTRVQPMREPPVIDITDAAPPFPPESLDAWLRLPMRPILDPDIISPADRSAATQLLALIPPGQPCAFTYLGGSEPGTRRSVFPILLFQKFDPALPAPDPRDSSTYLLAYCHSRQAPRTFRLDRIQLVAAASAPQAVEAASLAFEALAKQARRRIAFPA